MKLHSSYAIVPDFQSYELADWILEEQLSSTTPVHYIHRIKWQRTREKLGVCKTESQNVTANTESPALLAFAINKGRKDVKYYHWREE